MISLDKLNRVWALLAPRERRNALKVLGVMIVGAFASAAMVGSVFPFLSVLANPALIRENAALAGIFESGGFTSDYRFLVALGLAAVTPAAAQSVNRNLIDQLNLQLIYVALPLTLFVEVILVYAVIRFRNNDDPEPTAENPTLEVTWTVATAIVLVFVGWSAYNVLASPYISPTPEAEAAPPPDVEPNAEIGVLAYQWGWQFDYAAANVTTQNLLVLPRDEDARLRLRSSDVVHSLYVPKLGLKQDVFPGQNTTILTRALESGRYRGYCTEFCGDGHARMRAQVYVVEPETYRQWLAAHEDERLVTAPPNTSVGNATGAANASARPDSSASKSPVSHFSPVSKARLPA